MKLVVIGGKLQGVEAAYLAHKAGWEVVLIDRKPDVPASGLSDVFFQLDVTDVGALSQVLEGVEFILPATENIETLNWLEGWNRTSSIPLVFDADAYRISSSKVESDRLFSRIGVPVPKSWPGCGFPVVAKPSGGSGSEGVRIFGNPTELENFSPGELPPDRWVLQEYVEGPSYSLEVVGVPGRYEALQVTDLEMDARYDCKRVVAPTELSKELVEQFKEIALRIAEAVQLRGLMDVEVILHKGQLKVLEIDARLPSQTPTVVYLSSGYNILKAVEEIKSEIRNPKSETNTNDKNKKFKTTPRWSENAFKQRFWEPQHGTSQRQKGVIYEHIKVTPGILEICGEHIMAKAGVLRLRDDFYGADEAITNYVSGRDEWVATLINTGTTRTEAWEKRERVIEEIRMRFKLDKYKDPFPGRQEQEDMV